MAYQIGYDASAGIITITYRGVLTSDAVKQVVSDVAKVIQEQECFRVLTDMREGKLRMTTMNLYEYPKLVARGLKAAGIDVYTVRRALVVKSDLMDFRFMETVGINVGHSVRIFSDIDEAKRWLLE